MGVPGILILMHPKLYFSGEGANASLGEQVALDGGESPYASAILAKRLGESKRLICSIVCG